MKFLKILYKGFLLFLAAGWFMTLAPGCSSRPAEPALFEVLDHEQTGLHFSNQLSASGQFNLFTYMYFYNGAGVGAGDFNNDGLIDLFFASNQQQNKLYLNAGGLQFKDVTEAAGIPNDGGWSTGVSVVDINNDGLLDIYVCRVGNYEVLHSQNQLLMCQGIDKNGIPVYKDKARDFGLNFSGFSTQAAFLDYDNDGDVDMFLLNHSVHANSNFRPRRTFAGTYDALSGDRFYRNDGSSFTDVTRETGINSSVIGYGLGVTVADINLDGYPDIYVGNDFHENDYVYVNQRNGTFKDDIDSCMMHTSQFSMGVDVADVNNDGYSEVISMDMLPCDPYILKRSLGEDAYDIFFEKIRNGYNYQYTRNNFQLNRGNGMFSEVGLYSGVYATDWSWSALWMDFNNDGLKDLFVSNGIPKRMNDIDYINYVSNQEIQGKIRENRVNETDMALLKKFPEIKIPNKFFVNTGQGQFKDEEKQILNNESTFSNGAIYADLDNDGDLDVVVNNINEPAVLYKNKNNDQHKKPYVQLKLHGPEKNINALGAKLVVFAGAEICLYEKQPVHGFLSAMEIPMHLGLERIKPDSVFLIWPDNTYQNIQLSKDSNVLHFRYQTGLPQFDYNRITSKRRYNSRRMENITHAVNLTHRHKENPFVEFDREPLIPRMVSSEGPALAVGDINNDGLEDVFIGSSKREKNAIYVQQTAGTFKKLVQPALDADSMYEDVDACWTDVNKDGYTDLVVASGGNEYYGEDEHLLSRVYLNDGKAQFSRLKNAIDNVYITASCVVPYDFNRDGAIDLFIGGRAVPWEYGQLPRSYLLQNDGTGKFKDVTASRSKELANAGFVTNATWFDLDKDGDQDLIVSLEWGGIDAYINTNGLFSRKQLINKNGWWNFILPYDIDRDGDIDLVAGNLGLNSRLKASDKEPVRLYYNDFDDNGKKEQVLTYYVGGKEVPFANKSELEKKMPVLKKRFLYAEDFAKATLKDLFTADKLDKATVLTADYFSNAVLLNDGKMNFSLQALPWEAQLTSFRDAIVVNANNDSLPDLLLMGNYYDNNIEMGRYDADFGTVLLNKGNASFACEPINGLTIKGQTRHIRKITIGKKEAFILARNNDSTMIIRFKD
ncbi:VCBS repeat-containing protein [Longitalea luteola]|uniref:VCBS repeat-containing protein n=1 Tax=Longitalea luteola TaxID=2812563 RepID=UPI001F60C6FC|nr:VCBS repeat-containing protein [Longitalea luteola]